MNCLRAFFLKKFFPKEANSLLYSSYVYETIITKPLLTNLSYSLVMKKLSITLLLLATALFGHAQCNPPANVTLWSSYQDSVVFTWAGPIDTFQVEFGQTGFTQGTGSIQTVYDTSFTFASPPLTVCFGYQMYVRRKCGPTFSAWVGPNTFQIAASSNPLPNGVYNLDYINCLDSLSPDSNGFKIGSVWGPLVPPDKPSTFVNVSGSWSWLYADGDLDTAMSFTTPWLDFTGGTQDAVFFLYSNNVTTPGDNVTFSVDVQNGVSTFNNVYTYSGDNPKWKKVFIDLSPYYSSATNKVKITFQVNQKTAIAPKWNDIYIDQLYVGDTSTCGQQFNVQFTRPTPTDVLINRYNGTSYPAVYQYGPAGFTPNIGQSGTISTTINSIYLPSVPAGTDWVYIKDSCVGADLHKFSEWIGPYYIDSTYSYRIYGTLAADMNTNCVLDTADTRANNKVVILWPDNIYGFTDAFGKFEFIVESGNYIVSNPTSYGSSLIACHNDSVNISTDTLSQLSPVLLKDQTYFPVDIRPFLYSPISVLQGDTFNIGFFVLNNSHIITDTLNVYYRVDTSTMSIVSQNGWTLPPGSQYYRKKVPPINPYQVHAEANSFTLTAKINAAILGQLNYIEVRIDTIIPYETPNKAYNNFSGRYLGNVAALDPNDKSVSPSGNTIVQDSVLNFRINFQNTGNYPAALVVVVDTLPAFLHNAEFELVQTSHTCVTTIDSNHVLKFKFYNIQLPDSTTDLEGSKGYIDFTMRLNSPMQIGDSLANRAHIFFDYQPAIITNWAWVNVIDSCDLILPEAKFSSNFVSLNSQGFTVDFTSTAKNAKTVAWNFDDGSTDTGTFVTHTFTTNGSYNVVQTIYNACGILDTATKQVTVQGIGIEENYTNAFTVYPNPATNTLSVRCLDGAVLELIVTDAAGRSVIKETMDGGAKELNVSNLEQGTYIILLQTKDGEPRGKRVIQIVR